MQVAHLCLLFHSRGRLPVHGGRLDLLLVLQFKARLLLLLQLCQVRMACMALLLLRSKQLPAVGSATRRRSHLPCQSQGIWCGSALLPLHCLLLLLLLQCLPLKLRWLMLDSRAGRLLSAGACVCILLLLPRLLLVLLLQTSQLPLAVCPAGNARRPLRTAASRCKVHCASW